MTTLRTRRGIVPIVARRLSEAERNRHWGVSPVMWEVRIAPEIDWHDVPYCLRSTYVCTDLVTPLLIAIDLVDSYMEHESFTAECDQFVEALKPLMRRELDEGELFVGRPL